MARYSNCPSPIALSGYNSLKKSQSEEVCSPVHKRIMKNYNDQSLENPLGNDSSYPEESFVLYPDSQSSIPREKVISFNPKS